MTPIESDFQKQQKRLERLATEKQIAGHHEIASRMRADIEKQKKSYKVARQRIDELVRAVAKNLLEIHGGTNIKLYVRERLIPYPLDVQEGAKLDDPIFLTPERPPLIGEFTAKDLGVRGAVPAASAGIETQPLPVRDEGGAP